MELSRKVVIIMPTKNNIEQLEVSIEYLLSNTIYPYKLIIVESDSTDGTVEYTDFLAKRHKHIETYHTKHDSASKAINWAIKNHTETEDVYLTQDDVIINKLYKRDWLTLFVETMKLNPGIITTLGGGGVSGPYFLDGFTWVGSWSCYIPRETINLVGKDYIYDENIEPGDDIEFCYRIYLTGKKCTVLPFWFDHHQVRSSAHHWSMNPEQVKIAGQIFRNKHNIKDGEIINE